MIFTRAVRWCRRLGRRHLLVAVAIAVLVLATCAPALADERGADTAPADTTALARSAIVAGRLDDGLRLLSKVIASDRPDDERAAAAELRAIADRWVAMGGVLVRRDAAPSTSRPPADGPAVPPAADAWENAFSVARARLVAGDFENAAPGFHLLLGSAPTNHQSLRAHALAALARALVDRGMILRVLPQPVANAPAARSDGGERARTQWYGWQTLITDGASVLVLPLFAASAGSGGETIAYAALGGYLFGAPVVHLAHGRPGVAMGSLALRVGLPLLGAALGVAAQGKCGGDFCGVGGAVVGGALGVISATVLDAAVLSYEKVDDDSFARDASRRRAPPRVALTPLLAPRLEGGVDVGLGGAF